MLFCIDIGAATNILTFSWYPSPLLTTTARKCRLRGPMFFQRVKGSGLIDKNLLRMRA